MEELRKLVGGDGWIERERRLLGHEHYPKPIAFPELAVIERNRAGEHAEERALAAAVAADEAYALALLQRERGAVEERQVAVGKLGVREGEKGHVAIRLHQIRGPRDMTWRGRLATMGSP